MLSLISSAIATHLSLIFTAAPPTHHRPCTGISSSAPQNSCQLAPGLMSHTPTPTLPWQGAAGNSTPDDVHRAAALWRRQGRRWRRGCRSFHIDFLPPLPCLALLASPTSSLRAHQGHDNMHSHAEEAQQVAWKTCFRDILPDVCI